MYDKILAFFTKGQNRTIAAKKNIFGMFFLKGLSIILSLIVVPLTIDYVSPYQYGIWLTISSLIAWLSFFDIGLGNGLRNKFIEAITSEKITLAKIYVSTSYAILSIIVVLVGIFIGILCFLLDWSKILNAPSYMAEELRHVVLIVLVNFCFQFVLKLVSTLLNAIQKPALSSLFDTLSQLLVTIAILFLIGFTSGSLINLAITFTVVQLLVLLLGSVWAYSTYLKKYRPDFRFVRFSFAKDIMSLGIKFFFLQIIAIICYQTNNIIITQILGPSEVTIYNIAYKYMYILTMVFTIILAPFWSAFAEAKSLSDYSWMKNVTKILRRIFYGITICGVVLVVVSPFFYKFWIGDKVIIPFNITFLMGLYHLANTWGGLHTNLLAGLGKIKLQLIFSSICGIINIPISLYFCKFMGLSGLLMGNIIVLLLFNSWFGYIQLNKLLNKTAYGIWNE